MVITDSEKNKIRSHAYLIADKVVDSILNRIALAIKDTDGPEQQQAAVDQIIKSIMDTADAAISASLKGV